MSGITVGGNPSFQTCDEIPDSHNVEELPSREWSTWAEVKKKHPSWQFNFDIDASERLKNIRKFRECWDFHGNDICASLREEGYDISYCPVRPRDLHILLVLPDASSNSLEAARTILTENAAAEKQYCSIFYSDKYAQTQAVIEKVVCDLFEDGQIKADRSDERMAGVTVMKVIEAAKTYITRGKFSKSRA